MKTTKISMIELILKNVIKNEQLVLINGGGDDDQPITISGGNAYDDDPNREH